MGILQARILEWVNVPFSRGSSWPRDGTQVSCIAGWFLTIWATREALFSPNGLWICWYLYQEFFFLYTPTWTLPSRPSNATLTERLSMMTLHESCPHLSAQPCPSNPACSFSKANYIWICLLSAVCLTHLEYKLHEDRAYVLFTVVF